VDPEEGLHSFGEEKLSYPCRDSNPEPSLHSYETIHKNTLVLIPFIGLS